MNLNEPENNSTRKWQKKAMQRESSHLVETQGKIKRWAPDARQSSNVENFQMTKAVTSAPIPDPPAEKTAVGQS